MIKTFDKLISAGVEPLDAIKTIISAKNDFSYIKTNLTQYQDIIVDTIMYDLGSIVSDEVKKSVRVEFTDDDTRAHSTGYTVKLSNFTRVEVFHEMGHILERQIKDVHRTCIQRLDDRTDDMLLVDLADYYDIPRDCEFAQDGNFINIYTGKRVMYDVTTELLSTGLEYFVDDKSIMKFYKDDREHFQLVTDIISGKF